MQPPDPLSPSSDSNLVPGPTSPGLPAVPMGMAAASDRVRTQCLVVLTAILIGLCILVALPFLPAITWGVALAVIAWPLHHWINRLIERPALSAGITTVIVAAVILSTGGFVTYQLAREATAATEHVQDGMPQGGLREKVAEFPPLEELVAWIERFGLDVEVEARKIVSSYTHVLASLANGSVAASIQFFTAMFILYYIFLDRSAFRQRLRELLPLSHAECDEVFDRAGASVHANLYATLVTGLIDAIGGGFMFWVLGLPAPFLWGVVIFVLNILPVLGAGMVWFPAVVYLALSDRWLGAAALLGWGIFSFLVVGIVLYFRLAGKRMRMHEVPSLIAFLGGIAVFGLSGMILGPAIVAITVAFLSVCKRRLTGSTFPAQVLQGRGKPLGT